MDSDFKEANRKTSKDYEISESSSAYQKGCASEV